MSAGRRSRRFVRAPVRRSSTGRSSSVLSSRRRAASQFARSQGQVGYSSGRELELSAEHRSVPIVRHQPTRHDANYRLASGMILSLAETSVAADAMAHRLLEAHWLDDAGLFDARTLGRSPRSSVIIERPCWRRRARRRSKRGSRPTRRGQWNPPALRPVNLGQPAGPGPAAVRAARAARFSPGHLPGEDAKAGARQRLSSRDHLDGAGRVASARALLPTRLGCRVVRRAFCRVRDQAASDGDSSISEMRLDHLARRRLGASTCGHAGLRWVATARAFMTTLGLPHMSQNSPERWDMLGRVR